VATGGLGHRCDFQPGLDRFFRIWAGKAALAFVTAVRVLPRSTLDSVMLIDIFNS
jgi:hypothetical protein